MKPSMVWQLSKWNLSYFLAEIKTKTASNGGEQQYFAEEILRNETLGWFALHLAWVEVVDVQTPLLNVSWYRAESTMLAQN